MKIEEYISSGILEAYVLGDLSEKERSEVEKNTLMYPELKEELTRVEKTQEQLILQTAVQPREALREDIFRKIVSLGNSGAGRLQTDHRLLWRWAAAASITVAIVSSILAFTYYSKWKKTSAELNQLIVQNEQIAKDYNNVNTELNKLERDVHVIGNPAFRRITMTGTPNAPQSSASVYWNERTQEVYLRIHSMKELAQQNQYQLWAIIDGKPVDLGVFDGNVTRLLKMKNINGSAKTFAVTIEPRGGKPTPNLKSMQVAGNS